MARELDLIAGWLIELTVLIGTRIEAEELRARVELLAGELSRDYPAAVFCDASRRLAARKLKFFPSYSELCEILDEHWREHSPDRPSGDDEASALVRNWQRHSSGDWGKGHQGTPNSLRHELGFYRNNKPEAFARLVDSSDTARRIARANGWISGANIIPFRASATPMHQEVIRSDPFDDELDPA